MGIDFPHYPHHKWKGLGVCRPAVADEVGLGQEEEREEEEERKPCCGVGLPLPRRCMWRGRPGPTSPSRASARQRGTPAAPVHVARQRPPAAPGRPKGSPSEKNIFQRLILKIILKMLKLKKSCARDPFLECTTPLANASCLRSPVRAVQRTCCDYLVIHF
jgi:hypothetical protein